MTLNSTKTFFPVTSKKSASGKRLVEREQGHAGGQAKEQAGRKAGIHVERQGRAGNRWGDMRG